MVQGFDPGDQLPGPQEKLSPLQVVLQKIRNGNLPLPLLGGIATVVVVGLILVVVALGGSGGDAPDGQDGAQGSSGGLRTAVPTPEATIDLERATAVPSHLENVGPEDRFVIPRFGINAPLTHRKVPETGVMPDPEGADDVAYYDFSAFEHFGGAPGRGGNSVFAGHVDSGTKYCDNGRTPPPCKAVFWHVSDLRLGDDIEIHVDGNVYHYKVTSNQAVPANLRDGTWDRIVTSTAEETITLITCGGDFNRQTRQYTDRQVIIAVRVDV